MLAVSDQAPRYKEARTAITDIAHTVCFTMRTVQRIPVLLIIIIVYVCIGSGYAQINNCGLENFQCKNGQCIKGDLLCDGRADCRDSSDETAVECNKPEILCTGLAFRCNYGACITGSDVCNGIRDCIDNSDESQCNTTNSQSETPCVEGQFTCNNGYCIDDTAVCDGIRDCTDGSDEISICKSFPCADINFRCKYGACIDGNLRCNGVTNCADNSDEDPNLCRPGWDTILGQPTPGPTPTSGTRPTSATRPTSGTRPTATPPTFPLPSRNGCRAPPQPQNGHWKLHRSQCPDRQDCTVPEGTELGLGSHLIYSCDSGYKIRGSADVSCSIEGKWLNIPVCIEIRCKGLAKPSLRAECIYDDEWISCKSPVRPKTKATLACENSYRPETTLLSGQRKHVRCNANGQWEPEPMRCIPVCGTLPSDVTPTVVGGFRPNITEFPWHATLYLDEDGSKDFFCGASIIQESLLMTAAHCVYDETLRELIDASKIHVLTGNLFRDYNYVHNPNLVKKNQVKRIYIVRNYLGLVGNYLEDIAILELVQPFVLSAWLVPVCIDTLSDRSIMEAGTYGKVAGFGRTQFGASSAILQALIVPIIPLSQCRSVSQTVNTEQYITNDKFCAGYTNGSSVCDGDSGGGLVLKTNNLWYLRGIVSVSLGALQEGGVTRCNHKLYSLYTEVSRHISWIQDVITKIEQNQTRQLCSEQSPTRCSNLI